MKPLPPHVQAHADEILDAAPPLSPAQERLIQRLSLPVVRQLAARRETS